MTTPFLACDWGTTNLRAWRVGDDGDVEAEQTFPCGVGRLEPGRAAAVFHEQVRPALGAEELPALMCGMIGSTLGWAVAPYVPCPAGLQDLAAGLTEVAPGMRIVPGARNAGPFGSSDVMRGEETQILGWAAAHAPRGRHVICHPGTHPKWAVVEDGRLVRFATAMSGELFDLLRRHSVLKTEEAADDEAAFDAGVEAAGDGGALAGRLFSVRARVVADGAAPESSASYLSGLLIGAEVAAMPAHVGAEGCADVVLIGAPRLCRWYARALEARGVRTEAVDGEDAALLGLTALARTGATA